MTATRTKTLAAAVALATAALVGLEGLPTDKDGFAKPYLDVAGVLTDCYGNTKNVTWQSKRTVEECRSLMTDEAYRIGSYIIKDQPNVPVSVLAATISWAYNVGDGAYRQSTLRRELIAGRYMNACNQLPRWVYVTDPRTKRKVVSKGLVNRRKEEKALCVRDL